MLGAKGLAGSVRIEALTDHPERLAEGESIWIEDEPTPRSILEAGWGGRVPFIRLDGISDREAAERLVGRYLEAPANPLPSRLPRRPPPASRLKQQRPLLVLKRLRQPRRQSEGLSRVRGALARR